MLPTCPSFILCSKALGTKLAQMGFNLPQEQLNEVFKRFKSIADKKKVRLLVQFRARANVCLKGSLIFRLR